MFNTHIDDDRWQWAHHFNASRNLFASPDAYIPEVPDTPFVSYTLPIVNKFF